MTTSANRRQFLTGLSTLIAAPAIIKVASLMPVKAMGRGYVGEDWRYIIRAVNLDVTYGDCRIMPVMFSGFVPRYNNVPIRTVDQLPAKEI